MAVFRKLTRREILIFLIFVIVLSGAGYIAYLESDLTPVWATAPQRISLGADGLGIFIWKAEGGFWAYKGDRRTVFDASPSNTVRIVSLNGKPVGKPSGVELTDGSGRIIVVIKSEAEGPVTLKGIDLRSGESATVVRWSVAD